MITRPSRTLLKPMCERRVYTGLVLAAGLLLLALTYLLLRGSLPLPPPTPDDNIGGRLRQEAISDLLTRAALALLVVTALAGLTGWLVAGLILRPIRAISGTANRLSAEDLCGRVLNSQRLFVANAAYQQPPPPHYGCWRAAERTYERSRWPAAYPRCPTQ